MPIARTLCVVVSAFLLGLSTEFTVVSAADGDPIAVRRWPDGRVSIENHWGLQLWVTQQSNDDRTPERSEQKQVSFVAGIDHVLSRRANEAQAAWTPAADSDADPNSIRVTSGIGGPLASGSLLVQVDGVRILFLAESRAEELLETPAVSASDRPATGSVDVIVMADQAWPPGDRATDRIRSLKPRLVLLPVEAAGASLDQFADRIGAVKEASEIDHNTFAISKSPAKEHQTRMVIMQTQPHQLQPELESLFEAMEESCERSQAVFHSLSANQLNFKPANGTHTPRWNAEHMMGRQLLFFSQIYHAVDPAIPVADLNPKQMPPDYVAAHPDWDGPEEARQMQRVSDFTRRFAYLLRDIPLDVGAPGSRWTLRGLLRQMERHYDDHTANTKKKFELEDWPDN